MREGTDGAGPGSAAPGGRCFVDSKHLATPLRDCCGGQGWGGAERGEAASPGEGRSQAGRCGAGHARLVRCNGDSVRRDSDGAGGGEGRSDVGQGLGVAGWPDGACRDCTRRAATAAAEQRRRPPSSHRSSLLVSSRRAAPGRQKLCE